VTCASQAPAQYHRRVYSAAGVETLRAISNLKGLQSIVGVIVAWSTVPCSSVASDERI
jgi:hypothetical protein